MSAKGFELVLRPDIDSRVIGQELRRLRENSQVTLSDLAERMDWKVQNVSRLERGGDKREPTLSSVNLYVRMLGFELVLVSRPKKARSSRPTGKGEGTEAEEGASESPAAPKSRRSEAAAHDGGKVAAVPARAS